ncbi:TetR/AcrR family transcriptional regulator [Mangrovihabitans endophyticus]|uniref:HTH tetR-type domain-containing protein n=1 Tax=Mangrovihabitans endophyticus TaxID=1751298 RepID=A0A8J3BY49_9ACTN|nr:TetR-like C-terminal domain-containing protein [Mangrovihabitans endophyticus]GGK81513.1 hypothetical protein GCM10012284_14440 [Mangrovihabitans endophyticus]
MSAERGYHHGGLRAALIATSFEVLAESGLQRFSVAAVARRLGVSSAAPYRHFPDRAHLLAAVAAAAAADLRAAFTAAADAAAADAAAADAAAADAAAADAAAADAAADPRARLAAVAGAYVRYAVRTGAGFPVVFAPELASLADHERREETRALMTVLLDLSTATAVRAHLDAVRQIEAVIAVAHGYVSLYVDGFYAHGDSVVDDIAERAVAAARALIGR